MHGTLPRIVRVLAWTGLGVAVACAIAELLAGLGYRFGWWHFRTGIQVMRWAAMLDLAAVLIALIAVAGAVVRGPRSALGAAIAGVTIAVLAAAPPLYHWRLADQVPRIHDISTDTADPPRYVAVLPLRKGAENSVDYSAEVAAQQKKAYPEVLPAMLDAPPAQAFERAERAARAMGWEIVSAVPQELRIEATDTTLLFGFKDDIVVRISPNGAGSRVDVRSLSRVGRSDIGANARRVVAYLKKLGST